VEGEGRKREEKGREEKGLPPPSEILNTPRSLGVKVQYRGARREGRGGPGPLLSTIEENIL